MQNDHNIIPYYLVFRIGCAPYVLNAERLVLRREASSLLRAFARTRGLSSCIEGDAWNDFSVSEGISLVERQEMRFYALVRGTESAHQLKLLTTL